LHQARPRKKGEEQKARRASNTVRYSVYKPIKERELPLLETLVPLMWTKAAVCAFFTLLMSVEGGKAIPAPGVAVSRSNTPSPTNALEFLRLVGLLKGLKRTGWVRSGVQGPESVADHMYRMAMMAMMITDPSLDKARCIKIALVHDLAEALAGDITPHDGVSNEDKFKLESVSAALPLATCVLSETLEDEIRELWLEYEAGETACARMVKDFDKFEMLVQADEYERSQPGLDLSDFFASTDGYFKTGLVGSWDEELRVQRKKRIGD
ncbi:unnamed protein product, partial [Chrysoparadoxa australica]